MKGVKRVCTISAMSITMLATGTVAAARDVHASIAERSAARLAECRVVAGASVDFPADFTADPPMPSVPSLIDSSNSLSGRSEGVRLKVMRIFYVQGMSADAAASVDGVLAFWKQIADSGKVNSQIQPRVVSGLTGQIAEATLSIQGQPYRGYILAIPHERTLWQFITVFGDTPAARALVQNALISVRIPGNCG